MNQKRQLYLETYGCQMNVADSEVVMRVMHEAGYDRTDEMVKADVVLVNTCAVRENAEGRIYVTTNPGVQVIGPEGRYLGIIPTPRPVISVAFGTSIPTSTTEVEIKISN